MNRRQTILIAVLAGLLLVVVLWAYDGMATQRRAAHDAAADLIACRRMAGQIAAYSRMPTVADEHERMAARTTGLIESAAKEAAIDPSCLDRIMPEPPRRMGDTAYKEKPTHVLLKNVTLRQLTRLIHTATTGGQGLAACSIRITAPRPEDTGPLWTAEVTLTYLIYDPPQTR